MFDEPETFLRPARGQFVGGCQSRGDLLESSRPFLHLGNAGIILQRLRRRRRIEAFPKAHPTRRWIACEQIVQQSRARARKSNDVQRPRDRRLCECRAIRKSLLGAQPIGEQPQHRAMQHEHPARVELRLVPQGLQENLEWLVKDCAAEIR